MKIFISWSGERSKRVALLLRSWLQCVLQASTPWMSDADIDRGATWFSEINKALEGCINGIICITKSNQNKPWLLFEAGAIAKGIESSRVCTFLIDLEPKDVIEPLTHFNHTLPNKENMQKLIRTLNSRLGEYALQSDTLDSVFDTYWPQFENKLSEILSCTIDEKTPIRGVQDILNDVLSTVRRIEKRFAIQDINYNFRRFNNELCAWVKKQKRFDSSDVSSYACDICDIIKDPSINTSTYDNFIETICNRFGVSNEIAMEMIVNMANDVKESQNQTKP